jgi:tetratricopeptide (TPR) repeat protein
MNQLKAFVGHSFLKEDEELVRAFLEFFDHVREMGIGFEWEHAKPAEPKALAEKVRELTIDKNVFIGICTKRERVVEQDKLNQSKLRKGTFKVRTQDLLWKTSDWLIQEIGLCIGRGMAIILLVEEGLRQPGGLQGDLEYISFNRSSPEKCFNKILEMITSLIPKAVTQIAPAESVPKAVEDQKPGEAEDQDWFDPKEDWTRRHFEIVLLRAIATENKDAEDKIYQAYLSSPAGQQDVVRNGWEAAREYIRLIMGEGGALGNLQRMSQRFSKNSEIQYYLAQAYERYEEFEKAGERFKDAAQYAPSEDIRASRLSDAAIAFAKAGQMKKGRAIISEMSKIVNNNVSDGKTIILKTLRQFADMEKDDDQYLGVTEALLDIYPDDNNVRFALAYRYSKLDKDDLALYHYTKIPVKQREEGTWNNIGVANSSLNLNCKAVEAYRKSEELGGTLAMSNLADKYITAGFLPEAEEICARATKIENYDKKVGSAISRIREVEEEEKGKQEQIMRDTKVLRKFYREFGRACGKLSPSPQLGKWQGPKCKLDIAIKEGMLVAEGNYEVRSLNALASVLAGWKESSQTSEITKNFVKFTGIMTGLAVKCQVTIEEGRQAAKPRSLLAEMAASKEALMIISDDLNEIRVYEKDSPETQKFYMLNRIES